MAHFLIKNTFAIVYQLDSQPMGMCVTKAERKFRDDKKNRYDITKETVEDKSGVENVQRLSGYDDEKKDSK